MQTGIRDFGDALCFDNFKEGNIEITERAEKAVGGEVTIGKDVTEFSETVSNTVRRTDVDVEKLSDEEV